MKIYEEKSLNNFEFWCGAEETVKALTKEELDILEEIFEEEYPEGISATELNDMFWFADDVIAQWLGYGSFDELKELRE